MGKPIDLSQPQVLRALAHPVRLRILEFLRSRESGTATQVSQACDESVASCSYHLRILAKYGFIEPAERSGGREKPWRAVAVDTALDTRTLSPADQARAAAMAKASRRSIFETLERWAAELDQHPHHWQGAAFNIGYGMRLTADELVALRKELAEVLDRYQARGARPGTARVSFWAWGFPTPGNLDQFEQADDESTAAGEKEAAE